MRSFHVDHDAIEIKGADVCIAGRIADDAVVTLLNLMFLEKSNFNAVTQPGLSVSLRLQLRWKGLKETFFDDRACSEGMTALGCAQGAGCELCLCQRAGPGPAPTVKCCLLLCGAGEETDLGLCLIFRTALH